MDPSRPSTPSLDKAPKNRWSRARQWLTALAPYFAAMVGAYVALKNGAS